ncbi:MAG TPA: hypothetical protein ENG69_04380 [Candidatus Korarchaeota archaeon]|nr:hypothetical protein [Candidatus Korarchaeota archaeon]
MSVAWSIFKILLKLEIAVGKKLSEIIRSILEGLTSVEALSRWEIPRPAARLFEIVDRVADFLASGVAHSIFLSPLRPIIATAGALSPMIAVPAVYIVYLSLALISPLPVLDLNVWLAAILLWSAAILAYAVGAALTGLRCKHGEIEPSAQEELLHFALPLIIAGALGLAVNYMRIGAIPLLYPELRRHDGFWMISYDAYLLGLSSLVTWMGLKVKRGGLSRTSCLTALAGLMALTLALTIPSGFRLDVFVAVGTLVTSMWMAGLVRGRQIIAYFGLPGLAIFVMQKVLLMARAGLSGDPYYVLVSRAGFTLYSLTTILQAYPPWGMTYGVLLFVNPILTLLGIPRPLVGALTGEAVVGLPVAYTTSLVGPIWIDFGLPGVVLVPLAIGVVTGKVFSLARMGDPAAEVLYPILLSASLVWVESGPVHPYLYSFYAPALALILKRWVENRSVEQSTDVEKPKNRREEDLEFM